MKQQGPLLPRAAFGSTYRAMERLRQLRTFRRNGYIYMANKRQWRR